MTKQFFLIKLDNDPSAYTEEQWSALFLYIRNHDSENDGYWGRYSSDVSLHLESFKSDLTIGKARERIMGE